MILKLLCVLTLCTSNNLWAALPDYQGPEILARANLKDGYNIPEMSFLNNTSPVINNNGDITFKIMAVEGLNNQALWLKRADDSVGKIVYVAPDERFLTDPSISDANKIAFNLYDEGVTDGLFTIDTKSLKVDQVLSPDNFSLDHYTYPQIKNNGHIFFRGTNENNERIFYEFLGSEKLNTLLAEGDNSLGIKASYLFRPSANEAGSIAFKSRIGEKGQWDERNPDSILLISQSNNLSQDSKTAIPKITTIAKDRDSDPRSPYLGFGNSTSLSNNGYVAFIAVNLDSKKQIVLAKDQSQIILVTEGFFGISEIESFAPKVNDNGIVLFRAKDSDGRRALFLADEAGVKRLIGEGDDLQTDLGMGKILLNPNYPGFGGDVDMNDKNEIVFYSLIVSSQDSKELGSAVFKMSPKK